MFKKIIFKIFNFVIITSAQKCFVRTNIINSQTLFTYQGNVYDITNYSHPGGKNTLLLAVGNSLETFVQQPKYAFHLTSNKFTNDLSRLFVGVLKDNCVIVPPTVQPTFVVPTTVQPTFVVPTTTQPTFVVPTTTQPTFVVSTISTESTDMESATTEPTPSSANSVKNNIITKLILLIFFYLYR